jgi:hypothetical protein
MNPYKYSVSLRFLHPEIDPVIISKYIGIKPNFSWKAGEPRTTPKGDELGGTREETYWTGSLHPGKSVYSRKIGFEDFLVKAIDELENKYKFINKLLRTGGEAELFIGIFGGRDYGFEIKRDIIKRLGKIGISLGFCIYPEDHN